MVSNSVSQKTAKFLRAGEKASISNFISWFCLKGKLLQNKIEAAVSCPESEGLLKVSAKSKEWFPNQPTKKLKFLRAGEKAKISNFMGCFQLKQKLPEHKIHTAVSCPDSEGLCKVSTKSDSWFPIQPFKKWQNFLEEARRPKFQISSIGFVSKINCSSKKMAQQFPLLRVKNCGKFG